MSDSIYEAYKLVCDLDLGGSGLALSRDRNGGDVVIITPDWLDASALSSILNIGRTLELSVSLASGFIRIEEHTSETLAAVEGVRRTLREAREEDDPDGT